MAILKTAVIGVGYLGKYHAEKYAQLDQSQLVAVCDPDQDRCQNIAAQHGAQAVSNYQALVGQVDAVSIVTPTPTHYEIAAFCLRHGMHVLVEKPITTTLQEADQLIKLATDQQLILQVGHLERFNNAVIALEPLLHNPRFIESVRLAPFKLRGIDVSVILDLMIHDIDIIQSIVKTPINRIAANGACVISPNIDIANARIEFTNGCVANVTASRVSAKSERKLRLFQPDSYIGADLDKKEFTLHRKGERDMFPGIPEIIREQHQFDKGDALGTQVAAFVDCVREHRQPLVSGIDGREALATAIEITNVVLASNASMADAPQSVELS